MLLRSGRTRDAAERARTQKLPEGKPAMPLQMKQATGTRLSSISSFSSTSDMADSEPTSEKKPRLSGQQQGIFRDLALDIVLIVISFTPLIVSGQALTVIIFCFLEILIVCLLLDLPVNLSAIGVANFTFLRKFCDSCKKAGLTLSEAKNYYSFEIIEKDKEKIVKNARLNARGFWTILGIHFPVLVKLALNGFAIWWIDHHFGAFSSINMTRSRRSLSFAIAILPRIFSLSVVAKKFLECNTVFIDDCWNPRQPNLILRYLLERCLPILKVHLLHSSKILALCLLYDICHTHLTVSFSSAHLVKEVAEESSGVSVLDYLISSSFHGLERNRNEGNKLLPPSTLPRESVPAVSNTDNTAVVDSLQYMQKFLFGSLAVKWIKWTKWMAERTITSNLIQTTFGDIVLFSVLIYFGTNVTKKFVFGMRVFFDSGVHVASIITIEVQLLAHRFRLFLCFLLFLAICSKAFPLLYSIFKNTLSD